MKITKKLLEERNAELVTLANKETSIIEGIRKLMGYIQNGTGTTVSFSQDDATGDFCCTVGKHSSYANSLRESVRSALRDNPTE